MEFTANIKIKLEIQDLEDFLSSALFGAIDYWGKYSWNNDKYKSTKKNMIDNGRKDLCIEEILAQMLINDNTITVYEFEEDKYHTIGMKDILNGFKKFFEYGYDRYSALTRDNDTYVIDMGNIDAEMADIIIQLSIFDDIIYG